MFLLFCISKCKLFFWGIIIIIIAVSSSGSRSNTLTSKCHKVILRDIKTNKKV